MSRGCGDISPEQQIRSVVEPIGLFGVEQGVDREQRDALTELGHNPDDPAVQAAIRRVRVELAKLRWSCLPPGSPPPPPLDYLPCVASETQPVATSPDPSARANSSSDSRNNPNGS